LPSIPLISVITVVYNNVLQIQDCIKSVCSQDYPSIEYIIIDGGSTDGTLDTILEFGDEISEIISEPDMGIYDAYNKGISRANGEIIGFLNSDDLFANNGVLSSIAFYFENKNIDITYGDLVYIRNDDSSSVVRHWVAGKFSSSVLRCGWMPPHPTFYARRELYKNFGEFDLSYKISADYDCMLRFLKIEEVKVFYIPEVLVKMRTGGASNNSPINIIKKLREDYLILKKNEIGVVIALISKKLIKVTQYFVR
jgi:glycosyltransferase involved in cell wall biosynthesis